MGGNGKFLLDKGESQEKGGRISSIIKGWQIFEVSSHSWQRSANSPYLWRPLYCLPLLFQFFSQPSSTSLSPPTPTSTVLSVVLFLWLNGWSRHIWCANLLNDNMDLHMSNLGTLVPERPWCVFYGTKCQVCWGLTNHVGSDWYFVLIPLTFKHINTPSILRGH